MLLRCAQVFEWVASGSLNVSVDRVFPLAETANGHRYLEAGKSTGKVLYDCSIEK